MSMLPDRMRGVSIRIVGSDGGPEALEVCELPVPDCGENDVLIKVAASGINRPDVLQRKGVYPPPPGHSPIPGLEVSGEIACVGANVSLEKFNVGDGVMALTNGGGYAEFVAVPHEQVLHIPRGLSFQEACCIPETFFTVYHVMFEQCNIFGEKLFTDRLQSPSVLVHGGSSGIGTCAIQMARACGAKSIFATCGSEMKCKLVETLGATAINYRTSNFRDVLTASSIDFALDMVAGSYINDNLSILSEQGRLAVIGSLGSPIAENVDMRLLMRKRCTIGGSTIRAQPTGVKARIARGLSEHILPHVESGEIKVILDPSQGSFHLDSIADAHRLMESSNHVGKLFAVVDSSLLTKKSLINKKSLI